MPSWPAIERVFKPAVVAIAVIAAIVDISQFIQLLSGDRDTITLVIAAIAGGTAIFALIYIGFSRTPSPITSRPIPQYLRFYKPARALLAVFCLCIFAIAGWLYLQDQTLNLKTVILVADFDGPDAEKYHVTDELLSQIRKSLAGYEDTIVQPLGKVISESDSNQKAREIGKSYRADFVIWGWYGVTGSSVRANIHIENLSAPRKGPLGDTETYATQDSASQVESFEFQQRLSKKMTALTLFVSALARFNSGDNPETVRRLDQAIELNEWPDALITRSALYFYKGFALSRIGKQEGSIESYSKSIEILQTETDAKRNARLANSYNNRGDTFNNSGRYDQAIADFDQAVRLNPRYALAYNNRGIAYGRLKMYERAIQDFDKAIEIDATYATAYSNRGLSLVYLGENEKSLVDLQTAIKLDPKSAYAYHNLGLAHFNLAKYTEAISDYRNSLAINPEYAESYTDLGRVYIALGDSNTALVNFTRAIEVDPLYSRAYVNRGILFKKIDKSQQAIADFNQAIQLDQRNVDAFINRGILYGEIGEFEKANADFSAVTKIDPQNKDAYNNLGVISSKMGDDEKATALYSQAIQISNQYALAYYNRGRSYLALDRDQEAIADFRKVLQLAPDEELQLKVREELKKLGITP